MVVPNSRASDELSGICVIEGPGALLYSLGRVG